MYNPHNRRLAYAPGSGAREDRTISEAMVTKVVQAVSDNPECTVKDIKAVLREMGLKNDGQQQEAIREARQLRLIHHQIPDVPIEDNPGKGKPQRNIVTNEGREWLEMRKT